MLKFYGRDGLGVCGLYEFVVFLKKKGFVCLVLLFFVREDIEKVLNEKLEKIIFFKLNLDIYLF